MEDKIVKSLPAYHWKEDPIQPPRHARYTRGEWFLRQYGILIAVVAAFTIYTIILSAIVDHRAVSRTKDKYEDAFESWKLEYISSQNLLTGEASRAAAMETDAIALAHDGDVWKTEEAFKTYCWNAIVRMKRADYPNSIQDVLQQTGQYAFHNPSGAYSVQKKEWAMEVLEQAYADQLPRYLTLEHQYLEMRNDGEVCILHSCWNFNTIDDEPWRYRP